MVGAALEGINLPSQLSVEDIMPEDIYQSLKSKDDVERTKADLIVSRSTRRDRRQRDRKRSSAKFKQKLRA